MKLLKLETNPMLREIFGQNMSNLVVLVLYKFHTYLVLVLGNTQNVNSSKVLVWNNLGAKVYWLGYGIGMSNLGVVIGLVYTC